LREETLLILGNDNDSSEQGRQIKLIYDAPSDDYRDDYYGAIKKALCVLNIINH